MSVWGCRMIRGAWERMQWRSEGRWISGWAWQGRVHVRHGSTSWIMQLKHSIWVLSNTPTMRVSCAIAIACKGESIWWVRWSGCICIFCAGRCMEFQENWSQFICSCTTHNIGLSGRGRTHPHKRVHHDHASICGICRVLDRSTGIGHFRESKCLAHSALPFSSPRRVPPSRRHDFGEHNGHSRFFFPFSFFSG